jgi:hypothetical protein
MGNEKHGDMGIMSMDISGIDEPGTMGNNQHVHRGKYY